MQKVIVYDSTLSDKQSAVRGVGRYLQLLKENFPKWTFDDKAITFVNPFFNFLQPPLVMKRIAKKQIAVIHDLIPLKYPKHFPAGIRGNLNIFLNKLALKNYDLIVTDSEASKKDIVQILKVEENRVKVIYPCLPKKFVEAREERLGMEASYEDRKKKLEKNPTSIDQSSNPLPNPSSNFCLYVGDATWNKNLVNLAKAIKIINVPCVFVGRVFENLVVSSQQSVVRRGKKNPNCHSNPWQKEFKEFIELTKDDKRFIFAGYIDDYKLVKLYQQARLNILVSRDEGFGFSYLEAANFSCPSVLSDIPVFHEISNNKGVYFASADDPNDIANKIGEIYFNNNLREKLAFEAQQQSFKFTQKKFKKDWLTYLE